MSANVVFVNIDWKESRHHRTLNANMKVLAKTITDIVQKMNPTVICMCEVGETKNPLSEEQMQQVADKSISAWKDAATEHVKLRSMFTTGAPYMTIYVSGPSAQTSRFCMTCTMQAEKLAQHKHLCSLVLVAVALT